MKKCGDMNKTLSTKCSCVYMDLENKTFLNILGQCFSIFPIQSHCFAPVKKKGLMGSVRRPDLQTKLYLVIVVSPWFYGLISLTLSFPPKIRRLHEISHSQGVINRTIHMVLFLCCWGHKKKWNRSRESLSRHGLKNPLLTFFYHHLY